MPEIPTRVATDFEKRVQTDIARMKTTFGTGMEEAVGEALKKLDPVQKVELKASADKIETAPEKKQGRTSFAVESMNKGSAEALKTIFAGTGDKTPEKSLNVQKEILKETKKANKNKGQQIAVAPAVG
jgi:hypothetical protein